MLVDGRQRVQSKFRRQQGNLVWFGRVNGRTVGPGLVRDPAACRRPRRQPLHAHARGVRPRPVRRALPRAHRGRRGQALLRACADRRELVRLALRGKTRCRPARGPRAAGARRRRVRTRSTSRSAGGRRARRSTSSRRDPVSRAARRSRRQPLGDDAPARDPRPLAGDRDPGRVVLRAPARAAPRSHGRRRALPRRRRAHPDDPGLGVATGGRRAADPHGDADGRRDRGDLRGLRRAGGQAALGRQDPDVHAAPRAPGEPLPGRPVRPPGPGRPRCRALVPGDAGGDASRGRGRTRRHRRSSRASGARRCRTHARSDGASAPPATTRSATRSSSPTRRRRRRDLRVRRDPVRAGHARVRRCRGRVRRSRISSGSCDRRPRAFGAGARTCPPRTSPPSSRSPETSSASSATRSRRRARVPARRRLVACTTRASPRGTRRRRCSSARRSGGGAIRGCQRRERGTSRPGVAIRRPLRERK